MSLATAESPSYRDTPGYVPNCPDPYYTPQGNPDDGHIYGRHDTRYSDSSTRNDTASYGARPAPSGNRDRGDREPYPYQNERYSSGPNYPQSTRHSNDPASGRVSPYRGWDKYIEQPRGNPYNSNELANRSSRGSLPSGNVQPSRSLRRANRLIERERD